MWENSAFRHKNSRLVFVQLVQGEYPSTTLGRENPNTSKHIFEFLLRSEISQSLYIAPVFFNDKRPDQTGPGALLFRDTDILYASCLKHQPEIASLEAAAGSEF